MRIKKNLISTEIEITPQDLVDLRFKVPKPMANGLLTWIKKEFGINLWLKLSPNENSSDSK